MPTLFVFSARKVLTRASQGLLALCLAATAVTAGANQRGLDPHLVNAEDVSAAKNLMLQNPKEAFGALRDLKDRLVRYGQTDGVTTVQNVHWLYAQAAADVDCVSAYKAIYQSAALGFVAQAPHRAEVFQKREGKLLQCLPEGARERIELEAWRELRTSPLRDITSLANVNAAHAGGPGVAPAVARAAEAEGTPAATSGQPAEAASATSDKPELASNAEWLKSAGDTAFSVLMFLVVGSILFSIFKAGMMGVGEGTSSTATPATPKSSSKSTTSATRAAPAQSSTATARRPTGATKRRRVGLVRIRPWD